MDGLNMACFRTLAVVAAVALLAGCASTPPVTLRDPVQVGAAERGARMLTAGRYDLAADAFAASLERARMSDDTEATGNSAYNLAVCNVAMGRMDEALRNLQEARRAFGPGRAGALWMADLLEARVRMSRAEFDAARGLVKPIVTAGTAGGAPELLTVQACIVMAEIECAAKRVVEAEEFLKSAASLAEKAGKPAVLAGLIDLVDGHVRVLKGDMAGAAAAYDRAADECRAMRQLPQMADALSRAGACHGAAGAHGLAGDRQYRAAASYLGQGNFTAALTAVKSALESADRAKDPSLEGAAKGLFDDITRRVEAARPVPPAGPESGSKPEKKGD